MEDLLTYVDLPAARAARGLRIVVASALPSPWSEALKGMLRVKEIPAMAVRLLRSTPEHEAWSGVNNLPVMFVDDEPPRSSWAAIITRTEGLGGRVSLVPAEAEARARMFGLVHELAGEGGSAGRGAS